VEKVQSKNIRKTVAKTVAKSLKITRRNAKIKNPKLAKNKKNLTKLKFPLKLLKSITFSS